MIIKRLRVVTPYWIITIFLKKCFVLSNFPSEWIAEMKCSKSGTDRFKLHQFGAFVAICHLLALMSEKGIHAKPITSLHRWSPNCEHEATSWKTVWWNLNYLFLWEMPIRCGQKKILSKVLIVPLWMPSLPFLKIIPHEYL